MGLLDGNIGNMHKYLGEIQKKPAKSKHKICSFFIQKQKKQFFFL
jgi:hypothetical protein